MYISIQKFVYIIILFVLILQYSNSYKLVNRVRNKIVSKNDVTAINNDAVNNMMKKGLTTMIISLSLLSLPLISLPSTSFAADSKGGLIYKTGKSPKQEDPNDPKKGTKKESSFLRCLSNCKADCQKPGEGNARLDCQQDCQDQCCNSYEQCSFKVKTRSNDI